MSKNTLISIVILIVLIIIVEMGYINPIIGKPGWFRKMKGVPPFMRGSPVPISWHGWVYFLAAILPASIFFSIESLFFVGVIWLTTFVVDYSLIQYRLYSKYKDKKD